MNKQIQRLLGVFLAACLALAGTAGLSPWLHQLVEHGGHGPWHTHAKVRQTIAASHWHAHDLGRAASAPSDSSQSAMDGDALLKSLVLAGTSASGTHPGVARQGQAGRDAATPPATSESDENSSHQHHSLSQSLLNGLAEFPLDGLTAGIYFPLRLLTAPAPTSLLLACGFDSQTASRGPPLPEPSGFHFCS